MARSERYLGDSVYAELTDSGLVLLYLSNGAGKHSEIYLEPETLAAFREWISKTFPDEALREAATTVAEEYANEGSSTLDALLDLAMKR